MKVKIKSLLKAIGITTIIFVGIGLVIGLLFLLNHFFGIMGIFVFFISTMFIFSIIILYKSFARRETYGKTNN